MSINKFKSNISRRAYTGLVPSKKNGAQVPYDSGLESDYIYLLEFTPYVFKYIAQPLTLEFKDENNRFRKYTPDFLVHYHQKLEMSSSFKPRLVEIKYRQDLKKNWEDYKPKFKAAIKYASEKGWEFKIMTEIEIRSDYLNNVKFLASFQNNTPDYFNIERIEHVLKQHGSISVNALLDFASASQSGKLELIPVLWYLISSHEILCDLRYPLNMDTLIYSGKNWRYSHYLRV